MYDILFICAANVGRSQMAEGFYNHYTGGKNSISAGIEDKREDYKCTPHPLVVSQMTEKGVNISGQRMDVLDEKIIGIAKRIITFEKNGLPNYVKEFAYFDVSDPCPGKPKDLKPGELKERNKIARDKIEQIVLDLIEER